MLFGSKGLPDIVKNLGKGMREIRAASDEIKKDIQNSALEMRRDLNVPTVEELTQNPELKEIENLAKLDEEQKPQKLNHQKTDDSSTESKA